MHIATVFITTLCRIHIEIIFRQKSLPPAVVMVKMLRRSAHSPGARAEAVLQTTARQLKPARSFLGGSEQSLVTLNVSLAGGKSFFQLQHMMSWRLEVSCQEGVQQRAAAHKHTHLHPQLHT